MERFVPSEVTMPLALDDLTTMALFLEVIEHRSFTAAAAASGLGKATVSRRIAELERRMGCRLLQAHHSIHHADRRGTPAT